MNEANTINAYIWDLDGTLFDSYGSIVSSLVDVAAECGAMDTDTEILKAMGADHRLIHRVFMNEGLLISVAGGVIGLLLGIVVVLLQQRFGFVKFGSGGNYIVDAYPVLLKFRDVLLVFVTILVVGCASSFFTVRHAMRRSDSSR